MIGVIQSRRSIIAWIKRTLFRSKDKAFYINDVILRTHATTAVEQRNHVRITQHYQQTSAQNDGGTPPTHA